MPLFCGGRAVDLQLGFAASVTQELWLRVAAAAAAAGAPPRRRRRRRGGGGE